MSRTFRLQDVEGAGKIILKYILANCSLSYVLDVTGSEQGQLAGYAVWV